MAIKKIKQILHEISNGTSPEKYRAELEPFVFDTEKYQEVCLELMGLGNIALCETWTKLRSDLVCPAIRIEYLERAIENLPYDKARSIQYQLEAVAEEIKLIKPQFNALVLGTPDFNTPFETSEAILLAKDEAHLLRRQNALLFPTLTNTETQKDKKFNGMQQIKDYQIREWFLEIVKFPAFVKELSEYQLLKVKEYAQRDLMHSVRVCAEIMDANQNYNYPPEFAGGREIEYWFAKSVNYQVAKQAINLITNYLNPQPVNSSNKISEAPKPEKPLRYILKSDWLKETTEYKYWKEYLEENNEVEIILEDGTRLKVFTAGLSTILHTQNLPVKIQGKNQETEINQKFELIDYFAEGYKEGCKYFETEYQINTNTLYSELGQQYILNLAVHYFGEDEFSGWNQVRTSFPKIITKDTIMKFGYNSALTAKVEELIQKHPSISQYFKTYKTQLLPEPAQAASLQEPTQQQQEPENKFNGMPLNKVIEFFKPFTTELSTKNNKPFLTEIQFQQFIKQAFCKNHNQAKQTFNLLPKGEDLFLWNRFYQFYSECKSNNWYETETKCRDKYIRLLTENFTNWSFEEVKANFNKKPGRNWPPLLK